MNTIQTKPAHQELYLVDFNNCCDILHNDKVDKLNDFLNEGNSHPGKVESIRKTKSLRNQIPDIEYLAYELKSSAEILQHLTEKALKIDSDKLLIDIMNNISDFISNSIVHKCKDVTEILNKVLEYESYEQLPESDKPETPE